MPSSLGHLGSAYPLPAAWASPVVVEDTIEADGLELHRAGLSSVGPGGVEMVGSAADPLESPIDRAYFELIERVSTTEARARARGDADLRSMDGRVVGRRSDREVFPESNEPTRWCYSSSNGVAVHVGWQRACQRALWELCERDRLLRTWFGEVAPEPTSFAADSTPLARARGYEWIARAFPEGEGSPFSSGVHVYGVFGFPEADAPLVYGFGARPSAEEALLAAVQEVTQHLAFLWGEELPQAAPSFAPTPLYHLETFQRRDGHERVRRWLAGEHRRYRAPPARKADPDVAFVDLTPEWLHGLCVSKAVCSAAVPLVFGHGPHGAHLPEELQTHPIA